MLIKKFFFKILLIFKEIQNNSYKPEKSQLKLSIPYYSQFASEKLAENFIKGTQDIQKDPKWRESGAETKKEYAIWAWNGCGMACLKMILHKKNISQYSLVELGQKCLRYGGYVINDGAKSKNNLKNYYDGLFYKPFLNFIKKEFNVKGEIIAPMIKADIIRFLGRGQYLIASVNPQIRDPMVKQLIKRGHLVLVVGYDFNNRMFYLHNPSGFYGVSQKYAKINFRDFDRFFTHKGMALDV